MTQTGSTRLALMLIACTLSYTASAYAADPQPIRIPPGDLIAALESLARQSGVELVYQTEQLRGLRTRGANGKLSPREAVIKLLEGTLLQVRSDDASGALLIAAPRAKAGARPAAATPATTYEHSGTNGGDYQVTQAETQSTGTPPRRQGSAGESPDTTSDGEKAERFEEIVVTAQKREERLIDVPQSVTVLSADHLTKIGATQFRDYANTIPGLNFSTFGAGNTQISMRGVTIGTDITPTVGVYVDEVPYGSSVGYGSGSQLALDLAPFDLERIEILRGPQGTLYGASTIGGLIKYVTVRPDAIQFGMDAQAGVSGTHHGGINFHASGAINMPLVSERAALRVSAFEAHDDGYIDNVVRREDANSSDIYGGRVDLLLTPNQRLDIRLVGVIQDIDRDGGATTDYTLAGVPTAGELGQRRVSPEFFDQRFRLGSATLNYDFGPVTLTSISSYQSVRSAMQTDVSAFYVPRIPLFPGGFPVSSVALQPFASTDKLVQEFRVASRGGASVEWLIGGFYTRETTEDSNEFVFRDPANLPVPNTLFGIFAPSRHEEYAPFGNFTWRLTEKLDVAAGVRYARMSQRFEQTGFGFGLDTPFIKSNEDVFTHLFNTRYRFTDQATGYLRYASGFRPGGPNHAVASPTTGLPLGPESYESDTLKSYEVGFRGETADRRFGIDVAGYFIDWSNIQIGVNRGGAAFRINAPDGATVRGTELTLTTRPMRGFVATGAFAYQDAHMSEPNTDLGARKGERLPGVPRFTAALNADYELPVENWRPVVGATVRYSGDRRTGFDLGFPPQYLVPDYTTADLRAGLTFGTVGVQLYVRNVSDEVGEQSAVLTNFGTARVAVLQPRTIGITLTAGF